MCTVQGSTADPPLQCHVLCVVGRLPSQVLVYHFISSPGASRPGVIIMHTVCLCTTTGSRPVFNAARPSVAAFLVQDWQPCWRYTSRLKLNHTVAPAGGTTHLPSQTSGWTVGVCEGDCLQIRAASLVIDNEKRITIVTTVSTLPRRMFAHGLLSNTTELGRAPGLGSNSVGDWQGFSHPVEACPTPSQLWKGATVR